jgi:hypothetical protein
VLEWDEVRSEIRELNKEKHHHQHTSSMLLAGITMSNRMEWAGHVISMTEQSNEYRALVEILKRLSERHKSI